MACNLLAGLVARKDQQATATPLPLPVYPDLDLLPVKAQVVLDLAGFGQRLGVAPGCVLRETIARLHGVVRSEPLYGQTVFVSLGTSRSVRTSSGET